MNKLTLIQSYLIYITFASELSPLIFCLLFFKKLHTKSLKVFFIYTCLLFFFALASFLIIKFIGNPTLYYFVLRLYSIVEFSVIAMFFFHVIKLPLGKKIILLLIGLFLVFASVDYLMSEKSQFNNHSNLISSLVLIVFIIYYFYEKMKIVVMYPLYQSIVFWISVAFFLLFTGTFFFFLLATYSRDQTFRNQLTYIYSIVTITKNILLCLSLFATENVEEKSDELQIPTHMDLDEFSLTNLKKS